MTRATRSPMDADAWSQADYPSAFGDFPESSAARGDAGPDFPEIQQSPEFVELKRRLVRFIFPVSVLFFCWYLVYVLLAAYDHPLMGTPLWGRINVGIVLGLLQFVSTVLITAGYSRYARRKLDPQSDLVRSRAGVPNE